MSRLGTFIAYGSVRYLSDLVDGWSARVPFNLISPKLWTHVHSIDGLVGARKACPRGQGGRIKQEKPTQNAFLRKKYWFLVVFWC